MLEIKGAGFWTVDVGAGDVGRQQVGGKLHTVKVGFDAFGEGFDGLGFGQAGCAFY